MAYQAYASGGFTATEETPRKAAAKFFERFPNKRKCDLVQGTVNGAFFTVEYGRKSEGKWPQTFKDVTKKQVNELPDEG